MTRPALLDAATLSSWLATSPDWTVVDGHLVGTFAIGYTRATAVVSAILATVEELDHHPTVTLDYGTLRVEVWTHNRGGVTSLDLSLADAVNDAVANTEPTAGS